jgi:hypothetical protein
LIVRFSYTRIIEFQSELVFIPLRAILPYFIHYFEFYSKSQFSAMVRRVLLIGDEW